MSNKKDTIDYHDFVFKNGKFIGEFEAMYQHSTETPWHQDKTAKKIWSDIDLAILQHLTVKTVCDIGCGLGHFSARLQGLFSQQKAQVDIHGIDISKTAITKASNFYPGITFAQADMRHAPPAGYEAKFDCILIREVLWYVCDTIDDFIINTLSMAAPGANILISQGFPATKNWHGQNIFASPQDIIDKFSAYIEIKYICEEKDREFDFSPQLHLLGSVTR